MAEGAPPAAAQHIVLGTAGHIDHGKTTLVKALTGIDTDTLAEEKQRGITINLGFAYLDLTVGAKQCSAQASIRLGVVDVPGHARFIRNMAAGAAGIDLLLLVVAADDGVMPQTVEHVQICRLLGVRGAVVALTKADTVDEGLLELAVEDARELLAATPWAGCALVPVDSLSGRGLDELRSALAAVALALPPRPAERGRFRLAIDRSFSVRGAGAVATGTALSGRVGVDDELELLPAGQRLRVRGIQVHGSAAASAIAGQRTALNLAGADWRELRRGDVLAAPGWLSPTQLLDAQLELLPGRSRALRSGSAAELHLNTSELPVRLRLLAGRTLAPGEAAPVQLALDAPLACAAGDRFILRSSDGRRTLGGGVVLDPYPPRHVRRRAAAAQQLAQLDATDEAGLLLHSAGRQPYGLSADAAAAEHGWDGAQLSAAITAAAERGLRACGSGNAAFLTAPANRERLLDYARGRLAVRHAAHPLSRRGLSAAELSAGLAGRGGAVPPAAVSAVLDAAVAQGGLLAQAGTYVLPGHGAQLSAKDHAALKALLAQTRTTLAPPQPDALLPGLPVDRKRLVQLCAMLVEDGELATAPGGLYFDPAALERARALLRARLAAPDAGSAAAGAVGVTVSDFAALAGTTRKYAIPLLQLFEQEGWLKRDGDVRRLVGSA